jgi:hypothetical protein
MSEIVTFDPQPDGLSVPQCINIQITDDSTLEGEEMLFVELQSTNPDVVLDPSANNATVVILDNDSTLMFLSI